MANIKFSAFTQKVAQADVDFLVGYTGADNVRITPAALGDGIYLPLGGGTMTGNVIFNDNVSALFGTSSDMTIKHDGSNSKIENNTGDLYIINEADNEDIIFQSDDGAGGVGTYFFLDGSQATGTTVYTKFPDNSIISLGDGSDCYIRHDGTDTRIDNSMGDLIIRNYADDKDIIFYSDDGSGGTAEYLSIQGGNEVVYFSKDFKVEDNKKGLFGNSGDLQIYHNGSNSYIDEVGTGGLYVRASDSIYIQKSDGSSNMAQFTAGAGSHLYHNNNLKFSTTSTGISVTDEVSIGTSIIHTGDTDTKVSFGTDTIVLTTAGTDPVTVDSTGNVGIGISSPSELLELKPGAGGDSKINMVNSSGTQKALIGYDNGNGGLINLYNDAGTRNVVVRGYGDSYFNGGNFGILEASPATPLHVTGDSGITLEESGATTRKLIITPPTAAAASIISNSGTTAALVIKTDGGGASQLYLKNDGKVGIGTNAPTAALQVVGLAEHADNAAALTAGLTAGAFYRTGDLLKVVH